MNMYRVDFEDNKAVAATYIGFKDRIEFINGGTMDDDGKIKWLVILGLNEQDSINIANEIANDFL